jgi:hypothetical protein
MGKQRRAEAVAFNDRPFKSCPELLYVSPVCFIVLVSNCLEDKPALAKVRLELLLLDLRKLDERGGDLDRP